MERSDFRDAGVLARGELRARLRHLAGDRRRLLATVFGGLVFAAYIPFLFAGTAIDYGERLGSGAPPVGATGAVVAGVLAVGVYVGAATAFGQNRFGTVGPLVRTSIPPKAVVIGRIAAESLQSSAFLIPVTLVLLVLVGVGGGVVPPLLLLALAAPALLAGFLLGRVGGGLVRYANLFSGRSTWTKAAVWLAAVAGVFLAMQVVLGSVTGYAPASAPSPGSTPTLPGTPLQAYATLALAPLGATLRPLGVLVAALVLAATPVGLAATARIERALLFSDEVGAEDVSRVDSREVPAVFALSPELRVAWRYLLRTRRDPKMLAHLLPFLFGLLPMVSMFFTAPEVALQVLSGATLVVGVALAGGTYCLNPLGDDRDQLPFLLTSARSTAVLLRGRALAGVLVGLAFAVGVGTPVAAVVQSPAHAAVRTLIAPLVLAASAGIALGVGALVPKFERREYMQVERAHPSHFVMIGFLFFSMFVGGVVSVLIALSLGDAPVVLLAVGWLVTIAVLLGGGVGGYVYAVRKFDAFSLDDL